MRVIITGSCGLIGSEASIFYATKQHEVIGLDNDMRQYFFGPAGTTRPVQFELSTRFSNYIHRSVDIRERDTMNDIFREFHPDFVIHTAAQPSHDWAMREPFTDFDINAVGTLNLLEAMRKHTPYSIFILLSTNKVYGDRPNHLALEELPTRYEYIGALRGKGIDETLSVDSCLHSLFGSSKLAADIMTQEYGRYFGLRTGVFRGGCLSGSRHSSVELHGFLSYLVKCAFRGETYTIYGYKGKQVRDQIHASDVVQALELFRQNPRPGQVYNLGGGFSNSASILEIIDVVHKRFGAKLKTEYRGESRRGDHICYYSDMGKFYNDYPAFSLEYRLPSIIDGIWQAQEHEACPIANVS